MVNTMKNVDAASTRGSQSATRRGLVVGEERDRLAAGFGRLVRRERLALGLRQADLGELLSTQKSAISRLERGAVRPSSTMVGRLARALRVGRDERAVLELELALRQAAGPALRGSTTRTQQRRDRLDAVAYAVMLGGGAGPGDNEPHTSWLLRLLEAECRG
jgi:transcriptional regulator with XRE-family HTH domain